MFDYITIAHHMTVALDIDIIKTWSITRNQFKCNY